MICQSWKVMFHAEYSSDSRRMLVDLRAAVDEALRVAEHAKALPVSRRRSSKGIGDRKATASSAQVERCDHETPSPDGADSLSDPAFSGN